MSIDQDLKRAREILRGKARKDLKKHISHGDMIGRQGKKFISIPVPNIDRPRFRFGSNQGGVGMGGGKQGDPIGRAKGDEGDGSGQAGDQPGGHLYEVTEEELAQWLSDDLELPFLAPKDSKKRLISEGVRYGGERHCGPQGLLKRRATLLRAIRRSLSELNPDLLAEFMKNPYFDVSQYVVITPDDRRYHTATPLIKPIADCLVIFVMDVSGSMTDDEKDVARQMSWWIKLWLASQYDGIQFRFIIHDAIAKEVDEDAFFHTTESGGTRISSAYHVISMILDSDSGYTCPHGATVNPDDLNVYVFQFTDGDNWGEDSSVCLRFLHDSIMPFVTMLGYVQLKSPYGSGSFISVIRDIQTQYANVIATEIEDREGIFMGLKALFGKSSATKKKGGS